MVIRSAVRIGSSRFVDHKLRRLSLQATGNQMGDHFAIGRRAEDIAFGFEPFLERPVVLDHAIMGDGHDLLAADVRMSVVVGWSAVGGPASMADPDLPGAGRVVNLASSRSIRPADLTRANRPSGVTVQTPELS